MPRSPPDRGCSVDEVGLAAAGADPTNEYAFTAETYDAVVIAALAYEVSGRTDGPGLAPAVVGVTTGGERRVDFAECRRLVGRGIDIDYEGLPSTSWIVRRVPTSVPSANVTITASSKGPAPVASTRYWLPGWRPLSVTQRGSLAPAGSWTV